MYPQYFLFLSCHHLCTFILYLLKTTLLVKFIFFYGKALRRLYQFWKITKKKLTLFKSKCLIFVPHIQKKRNKTEALYFYFMLFNLTKIILSHLRRKSALVVLILRRHLSYVVTEIFLVSFFFFWKMYKIK